MNTLQTAKELIEKAIEHPPKCMCGKCSSQPGYKDGLRLALDIINMVIRKEKLTNDQNT